jgi:hypothetical protein
LYDIVFAAHTVEQRRMYRKETRKTGLGTASFELDKKPKIGDVSTKCLILKTWNFRLHEVNCYYLYIVKTFELLDNKTKQKLYKVYRIEYCICL